MDKHPFLSPAWIAEAQRLRAEHADSVSPPAAPPVRMNLVVTDVPGDEGRLDAHLDTSDGEPEIELGHLENAESTVTVDYALAKTVFVDQNMTAAMEGLQLGRIRIDGDMMKLMALATLNADAGSVALARSIRDITE